MRFSLAILYTPTTGKPLRVASIADPELLTLAAVSAIQEAEARASRFAQVDAELSEIEHAEADRLRQIFHELFPDQSSCELCLSSAAVM